MPKPWTSKLIIKALGVQKCNGSMDAATEDLPLEKAMEVAREKAGLGHLTGADLKAQTREVIGTCVSMRVRSTVTGPMKPSKSLQKENGTSALVEQSRTAEEVSASQTAEVRQDGRKNQ